MSDYFIGAHAYLCESEDGTVFMELSSGKYFSISLEQTNALRPLIKDWPSHASCHLPVSGAAIAPIELIDALLRARVITTCRQPKKEIPLCVCEAVSSFSRWQMETPAVPLMHAFRFAFYFAAVAIFYKLGKLRFLIEMLERKRLSARNLKVLPPPASLERLLHSFFRLRCWFYTAYNNCLFDSLMLSFFLGHSSASCKLVIGISTKPFRADAWVQSHEIVLNGCVENVQLYKRILVA